MHRTANGKFLDLNALKIQQENTIAVGNSRQNARGDILGSGGNIVKSRDEVMQEYYLTQKNQSKPIDNPLSLDKTSDIVADIFSDPITNGYDQIEDSQQNFEEIGPLSDPSNTGGISEAIQRSQDLAEKLKAQRRRI